ncbi:N-lysine methyltransferase KMT5A-A [Mugil cephalus]|uniref:N-lysine methyltransferase KMT5A-A n=1 Tax=Mugil cephalus TaxID=48193 RepID=UPI001FB78A87|nr:N-lysine methyltransferase KMT5A-A [Mugil cephalus]
MRRATRHENNSDVNGDIMCSPSLTVLSCTKSISAVHDENATIRLTQDGRRSPVCSLQSDAQRQEEDGSACWPDEQLHCPPTPTPTPACLRPPPPDAPMPLSNNVTHAPLHANNSGALHGLHGLQRRGVRSRKSTRGTSGRKNSQNRKVTDFYPIRRSSRKSKTELKCEQKKLLDDLILNGIEEGMEVQNIEGKGRAVFATRPFQKGDYVVEYHGDLLQITDAKKREAEYAQNPATGCYMYYFQYLCKTYCVDATKETHRKGRLINHSKTGNCQTKLHDINGVPHLILVASRDIEKGEELLYDYGDRSKASIAAHPWLKY